ncbi:AAA family ATPase [Paraburkholderia sp. MMS20-SJTR3]|uniref:AAA family ATPase n=1 Tax=Paraburkholderia sejongensis TaxID=2886946 RepID=A0ABS8JQN1_9BURK|nr:AAA family ATPase [Paraburkholderia sp. MMS20-SJTR3]MCC8392219.1 AAA family ATPase [Paraburkholderia sp. MMS20-SJTR3]
MLDLRSFERRTLCDDGEFVLARLAQPGSAQTWLALAPPAAQPAAESQTRLEHAYALRALLAGPALTTPHALTEHLGVATLVLDDPGGVSLASLPAGSLPLASVLALAAELAAALRLLHARGIIHKDLRPANVLVDVEAERVALTGFGRASRATREQASSEPPALTVDALAYLAPEQTGLMNRGVDARCDLYSLGVILYEMLSGHLPYRAASPQEWLHCHIAREPIALGERGREVPAQLAALVGRLLAKSAEARYQSALGLEADLRRCLQAWRDSARIEPFALGALDTPERLLLPARLYGRERESAALAAAFDTVVSHGGTQAVLISGYSGIGKSSLVEQLQKTLAPSHARFAAGKFDQYQRDIPYATLAQAFGALIDQLREDPNFGLAQWHERLRDALGANGGLIVELIPQLEREIGAQPAVPRLPPQEAQARFQSVLTRFIGTFCAPGQPLVLFLDDLQWLDAGTAGWLEGLANNAAPGPVLLVGAYRDNELGPAHALTRVLDTLRAAGLPVQPILLAPLGQPDIARLLADTLHVEAAAAAPLAAAIFDQTGGNPFYVVQFLHILEEEGLVRFDRDERAWRFEVGEIRGARFAAGIVDLMIGRIGRLSAGAQQRLRQFACVGNAAADATLARVSGEPVGEVRAALAEAVQAGLIYRRDDGYAFVHDRVQEAAYASLAPPQRPHEHLRIARMLSAPAPLDAAADAGRQVFEIANQYNRALQLLSERAERERIVDLNLEAGRRAKASSAYGSALTYLALGSELLGDAAWAGDYRRKFALEASRAECEFLTGATDSAARRLEALAARAANLPDRAAVAFLRITLFTALDQMSLAVQTCLDYLRQIGVDWAAHPGRDAARREYDRLLQGIGDRPIDALLELPLLGDEELAATLDVLTAVLPPAFFSDEDLVCLVLCRMANLSLAHGNSDASALGYAYLGMVAGPVFGDYQAAFGFGRLGLALVDQRGLERFKARVYMCFAYHVTPWTQHVRSELGLLRRAFEVASERGDLTYMGFSSCSYVTSLLAAGEPLVELEREAGQRLAVVKAARFGLIVDIISSQLLLIGHLRGTPPALGAEPNFDEARFEEHLESDPSLAIAACWHWIRKQQWLYHAGEIEAALAVGEKARPLLWTSAGHLELAEYHFYAALARARRHDEVDDSGRVEHADALLQHRDMLCVWARHCPSNFGGRAALVEAELARVQARPFDALRHYESAIRLAREHHFAHVEALAQEAAGRFCLASELADAAQMYLRNARRAWIRWGALAKVRALDASYPQLLHEGAQSVASHGIVAAHLDVETVVKASQAISGEIVLAKLMRTLMTIVLEHSGARRAVLVLPRDEKLCIEAEAVSRRDGAQVSIESRALTPRDVPLTLLHEALRTRELAHVDDALRAHPFSADDYLHEHRARSLLALPIVKQAKLVGVLYLENDLAPGVFSPARLTVLALLASQAAISLHNASLEHKEALLEEKEALLHEVHHRVKNNLQLISSLLNLQASRVPDRAVAELFKESRNRVRSMALVHENLYRAGNFARIMMAPHVRNLCGHLAQAYDVRRLGVDLRVTVDELQLDMNRAVSCGLIINELVSNAFKHAFADGRGGQLLIELRHSGDARCRLSIADDGPGLGPHFRLASADTLGLQLVHDLARQLHGSVDTGSTHAGRGATFTIEFPAEGG